jgi:hypothetical protein
MAPLITERTGAAGLGTGVARWAMLFTWAVGLVQELLQHGFSDPARLAAVFAAAACELVGVILVTERSTHVLAPPKAAAVLLFALAAVAIGLVPGGTPNPWDADLPAYLAALLIARGSRRTGATLGVLILALLIAVGAARGASLQEIAISLGVPVMALGIGILWRIGLSVAVRTERAHRSAEARAAVALAASERAAGEYRRQLHRIRDEVAPLLERIATADSLTADELTELKVAEGAIRDRLRSPRVDDPRLLDALSSARRRGVSLSMLWGEGPGEAPHPSLTARLADLVDDAVEGTVVIRATQGQDGVSFVHSGPDGNRRVVLDEQGAVVTVA